MLVGPVGLTLVGGGPGAIDLTLSVRFFWRGRAIALTLSSRQDLLTPSRH
jgi:hypothetical protein